MGFWFSLVSELPFTKSRMCHNYDILLCYADGYGRAVRSAPKPQCHPYRPVDLVILHELTVDPSQYKDKLFHMSYNNRTIRLLPSQYSCGHLSTLYPPREDLI